MSKKRYQEGRKRGRERDEESEREMKREREQKSEKQRKTKKNNEQLEETSVIDANLFFFFHVLLNLNSLKKYTHS